MFYFSYISFTYMLSLHCVGGFDDNAPLDCVEQYDPTKDLWTMVASTATPRGGVGVAPLCGKLYAVGGHDGTNYLDTVEAYDPNTNRSVSVVDWVDNNYIVVT